MFRFDTFAHMCLDIYFVCHANCIYIYTFCIHTQFQWIPCFLFGVTLLLCSASLAILQCGCFCTSNGIFFSLVTRETVNCNNNNHIANNMTRISTEFFYMSYTHVAFYHINTQLTFNDATEYLTLCLAFVLNYACIYLSRTFFVYTIHN